MDAVQFSAMVAAARASLRRRAGGNPTPSVAQSTFANATWAVTADGVATAALTYTARTAASVAIPDIPVAYAVGQKLVSAALSTLSTSPGSIDNDGVDSASSTITILNTDGNPVVGFPASACVMAVTGTNNTITQPSGYTDYAGRITGSFVSTTAETKSVSWTIAGLAITETDSVTCGTPVPGAFPNEPSGFTAIAEWNNETSITAGSFTADSIPFRSLTSSSGSLGSITTTTTAIVAAAGSWTSAGLIDPASETDPASANWPQYIRLANQDAGNNGRWCLIDSMSGTTLNVTPIDGSPLVANAVPDADWTADAGWGMYEPVSSGYTGVPSIGGANVMRRFYPAGVDGGHDAGRVVATLDSTKSEVFFGGEIQHANDNTTSNNSGGNKQFFVTFGTGTERFFTNFASAENWGIYIGSTSLVTSSVPISYAAWLTHEFYVRKPSGADNDGVVRLYIEGALAVEKTDCSVGGGTFPSGNFYQAYLDMSNNGNRFPTGSDPRRIGVVSGSATSSTAWAAALYVSHPT